MKLSYTLHSCPCLASAIISACLLFVVVPELSAQQVSSKVSPISNADNILFEKRTPKIIGGEPSIKDTYPFMTGITAANVGTISVTCGASYIGGRYVLTAAHCVNDVLAEQIDVWIGGHDFSIPAQGKRVSVQQIYTHEEYDVESFNKDIAVLELSEVVTGIEPLSLLTPAIEAAINEGELFTIMGWGNTDDTTEVGNYPSVLQETTVPLYNRAACLAAFGAGEITEFMMCAGYVVGGQDTCQGDSGGPMIYRHEGQWYQAGIVSFGNGCALANSPGIYTSVPSLLTWIEQKKEGVSYLQNRRIGFVESGYENNEVISITNVSSSAFMVTNVRLQDEVNLVNLAVTQDTCSGVLLTQNESCDIVVDTSSASVGQSSFTLEANTTTTLVSEILVSVNFTSMPSTAIDMASAVGSDNSLQTWYSGGDAQWILQNNRAFNGTSSVSSGNIDDFGTSVLLTKITDPTVKSITYNYIVSSEQDYDFLDVSVNGNLVDSFSGTNDTDFQAKTIVLTPGINRVAFAFTKDLSESVGEDRAYIDGISLLVRNDSPIIILNQSSFSVEEETVFTLDATGTRDPENQSLAYEWSIIGDAAATIASPNAISTSITAPKFADTTSMAVRLIVTDSEGASTSRNVSVIITQNPANVIVTPPPVTVTPITSSGGGGSTAWLTLLLLAFTVGFRKHVAC